MHKIKLSLSLFVIVFISAFNLKAQTDSTFYSNQLQFHFVNGYSLAYLNHNTESTALRYKLDLGLSLSTGNSSGSQKNYNQYEGNPTNEQSSNYDEDENNNSQSISVSFQYLWTVKVVDRLKIFIGAGPAIGYERNHSDSKRNSKNSLLYNYVTNTNSTRNLFNLGLLGSAFIQAEVTNKILLLAEYDLSIFHSWEDYSYEYDEVSQNSKYNNQNNSDGQFWNFNLSSIKLGIAFRF